MTNYELKMPANYAAIDAEEMTYLVGGETTGWQMFKDYLAPCSNYIARVFSAGSPSFNNVVTIVDTVKKINSFRPRYGKHQEVNKTRNSTPCNQRALRVPALGCSFVVKIQKDVLQKE